MFNSLWPSDTIWRHSRHSTLVKVMACCLTTPRHQLSWCWLTVNCTLRNKLQWNHNQNTKLFIQENAFENGVCKMSAILFRPQCVNLRLHYTATCHVCPFYIRIHTSWWNTSISVFHQIIWSVIFREIYWAACGPAASTSKPFIVSSQVCIGILALWAIPNRPVSQ